MLINKSDVYGNKSAKIINIYHDKYQFSIWLSLLSALFNSISLSTCMFCCNEWPLNVIKLSYFLTESTKFYLWQKINGTVDQFRFWSPSLRNCWLNLVLWIVILKQSKIICCAKLTSRKRNVTKVYSLETYHERNLPPPAPQIFDYLYNFAPCHSLLEEAVWICQIFLQLNVLLHAYKHEERAHLNINDLAPHKRSFFKFLNSMCLEYFSKLWAKNFVGCI